MPDASSDGGTFPAVFLAQCFLSRFHRPVRGYFFWKLCLKLRLTYRNIFKIMQEKFYDASDQR